ncbi:hypothetical protein [Haladaptatus litoreus]|uniref:hypothetical protein n=1 Tax=Haladaptatus litoreus TaxID=553468 RepID=UPI00158DCC95|nr:hypothetical protein [Haladaptatus litoreus]
MARGTSQSETPNPEGNNNLVTLKHCNEKNVLVADEDEWESFFAAQVEQVNTENEDADTKNQRGDDDSFEESNSSSTMTRNPKMNSALDIQRKYPNSSELIKRRLILLE